MKRITNSSRSGNPGTGMQVQAVRGQNGRRSIPAPSDTTFGSKGAPGRVLVNVCVPFNPEADNAWTWGASGQQLPRAPAAKVPLLDHLVGAQQEGFRDLQPERFRGLEVDHQLELGRL